MLNRVDCSPSYASLAVCCSWDRESLNDSIYSIQILKIPLGFAFLKSKYNVVKFGNYVKFYTQCVILHVRCLYGNNIQGT